MKRTDPDKPLKLLILTKNRDQAAESVQRLWPDLSLKPTIVDLAATTRLALLSGWVFHRSFASVLYTDDTDYLEKSKLWKLFLCVANARHKILCDQRGSVRHYSFIRHFFPTFLSLFAELVVLVGLKAFFWVFLSFYDRWASFRVVQKHQGIGPKRMAFLRTNSALNPKFGGALSHMRGFTDAVLRAGYEIRFLSSAKLGNLSLNIDEIRPGTFLTFSADIWKLFYNLRFYFKAMSVLLEFRPGFIYHRHDKLTFVSVLIARRLRVPLILEFNSSEAWRKENLSGGQAIWFYRMCEKILVRHSDHILCVSHIIKDQLVNWYHVPESKVTINPNGVDPERFKPDDSTRQRVRARLGIEGKIVVGFVGSYYFWHGVDVLASAMGDVVKKNPKVHFLWLGSGPAFKFVTDAVEQSNLNDNVSLIGAVLHSEIPEYLNACDILMSPNRLMENGSEPYHSPIKLFEYMAVQKAIIASNVGQMKAILEDHHDALLVEPGSKEDLVRSILTLSDDKNLQEEIAKNAREKVLKKYTWEINAQRAFDAVFALSGNGGQGSVV